jgi:hypothetical protein
MNIRMKVDNGYKHGKDDSQEDSKNKWSELLAQIIDEVTGKDISITYEFDDLEIDVPKATGPNGQELGSAKWKVKGKIVISSEVKEKNN